MRRQLGIITSISNLIAVKIILTFVSIIIKIKMMACVTLTHLSSKHKHREELFGVN